MARYRIPGSVREVTKALDSIGDLLTATEWTRAALVASIVRLDLGHGGRSETAGNGRLSARSFAELGINGLRSKSTVTLYVQNWLDAHDGAYPELGKTVTLPKIEWPPTRTGTDGYESTAGAERTIEKLIEKHGPEVIARAARRPEVARAVAEDKAATDAVTAAEVDKVRDTPPGHRGGGDTVMTPLADALHKLKMQLGTFVYRDGGKSMYEACLERSKKPQPWRPGEIEAIVADIDQGLRYGADAKALLTPVSDEDLADLLAREGG